MYVSKSVFHNRPVMDLSEMLLCLKVYAKFNRCTRPEENHSDDQCSEWWEDHVTPGQESVTPVNYFSKDNIKKKNQQSDSRHNFGSVSLPSGANFHLSLLLSPSCASPLIYS